MFPPLPEQCPSAMGYMERKRLGLYWGRHLQTITNKPSGLLLCQREQGQGFAKCSAFLWARYTFLEMPCEIDVAFMFLFHLVERNSVI